MVPAPGLLARLPNSSLHFLPFPAAQWHSETHERAVRCRASNVYGTVLSTLVRVRAVIEETLVIKVVAEPVLKLNTGILKCQVLTDDCYVGSVVLCCDRSRAH